jgi:hypothetical protein
MGRRWVPVVVPVVVLLGLLAGCESATSGRGAPEAAATSATSAAPGLPVPDDPTEEPTTTPAPTPTTPAQTSAAGRPCPADVARTLPGAGPATLVAGFGTSRFRLYFCRTDSGQLYYRGISRANAKQATTLAAKTIPGGYEARNVFRGDLFVYRVTRIRLTVTENGKQILADPVTATL